MPPLDANRLRDTTPSLRSSVAQRRQVSPGGARALFSATAGLNGRSGGNRQSAAYVMRGGIRF